MPLVIAFQSLEGIFGFFNQRQDCTAILAGNGFQSLEGIFGFFNTIDGTDVRYGFLFQSLEGIFGFFNIGVFKAPTKKQGFNP